MIFFKEVICPPKNIIHANKYFRLAPKKEGGQMSG